jgi:hypothetical protein
MFAKNGYTVTVVMLWHPVAILYVILAVPPLIPVTSPEELTVAFDKLLLLHVPDPVLLLSSVVCSLHTRGEPVLAPGAVLTVTVAVLKQP